MSDAPETEVFADPGDVSVRVAEPVREGFCPMCATGQHFHQPVSPLVVSGRCQNVSTFDSEGSPVALCDCLVVLAVPLPLPVSSGVSTRPAPSHGSALVVFGGEC